MRSMLSVNHRGRLIGPVEEKVTFAELAQDFLNDYRVNERRSISSAELSVRDLSATFGKLGKPPARRRNASKLT